METHDMLGAVLSRSISCFWRVTENSFKHNNEQKTLDVRFCLSE